MPDGGPPDAGDAVPDGGDPDASMMVDGGNALLDQCLGASDTAALAALVDGGTGVEAAQLLVLNCTLYSCLDEVQNYSGALSCIETCLDSTDLDALSTACTSCFVDMEVCAFDQCIIVCAGNDADACSTCIEAYCAPARTNCIGF